MGGPSLVGRELELEAISSFLDLDPSDEQALVLEGEAGIGKTALWRAGVEIARASGYRVLACTAGETETRLSFTTLRDLVAGAFDEVANELPPPQRRALGVILFREEPSERPAEPATTAVGFMSTFQLLASRSPTLLAIDDVQWIDAPSQTVLRYALRRIGATGAKALLSRRTGDGSEPLLSGLPVLEVGPFSVGALGRILHDRLRIAYPRLTLQRVHSVSGGNVFYALEIARAIEGGTGLPRPGEPLPVPANLLQLVRERLRALPAHTFQALAFASALADPTLQSIGAAVGSDALPLLEPAVDAEIVRTDGEAIRFAHPLFAASVYALAAPQRGEIHARLAPVVGDIEERARHLVRAGLEPDAELAAAIDAGAAAAAARGAPGAAAELAEEAARLTPPERRSDSVRRRLEAAGRHLAGGDLGAARSLLEPLCAESQPGPERARVLMRLAATKEPDSVGPVLEQAFTHAAGDIELLAQVQLELAWTVLSTEGARADLAAAVRATELAEQAGNPDLVVAARGIRLLCETLVGSPVDPEAVAWLAGQRQSYGGNSPPALSAALWLMYRDRLDEAREVLDEAVRHASARGEELTVATAAFHLVELECRAGRYEVAAERAEEALAIEVLGLDQSLGAALYAAALADVYLGRVDDARAKAERGLDLARSVGDRIFDIQNEGVLGFLDLSLGAAHDAADRLAPLWPRLVELGYGEPSVFPVLPNAIHALLETGDIPAAERLLEQLEERGRAVDSAWALSQAARLRALVAADAGATDDALALIDEALALHRRMPGPFERGRTLLARGVVLRRARRKREARETLEQALAIFEELGTPLWAAKARAELGRIGGRAAGRGLTPTERRIAELVSEGRSNKDVAAQLFITPRTVEGHLTRIYEKLGVRSRTELAHRLPTATR